MLRISNKNGGVKKNETSADYQQAFCYWEERPIEFRQDGSEPHKWPDEPASLLGGSCDSNRHQHNIYCI
jgi:hypothetical protein